VIPHAEVKILRRITEVQEGIMRASTSVLAAMFVLTLLVSMTAIISAEETYASAKIPEFGIMTAIGASRQKLFLQLVTEMTMAALLSAVFAYLLSRVVAEFISEVVFGVRFQATTALTVASMAIPFMASLAALFFVQRRLNRNVVEMLR